MKLYIKIKQAQKRKWVLDKTAIEVVLNPGNITLEDIIIALVNQQVIAYNSREIEQPYIEFLSENKIINKAHTGKVAFGSIYNIGKADNEKAIKNALQSFEDGLYAVIINKKVMEILQDKIQLLEGSEIIFIKLTLLKG